MNAPPFVPEDAIRRVFAQNLIRRRREAELTQSELAALINYSDKTVSKWERAEGLPDLFVAARLAALFNITVDELLRDTEAAEANTALTLPRAELPAPDAAPAGARGGLPEHRRTLAQRALILLLSVGLCFFIATACNFVLRVAWPTLARPWLCFIYAVPASCVLAVVFTRLWWGRLARFLAVSALIWTLAMAVQITLSLPRIALIYTPAAALQGLCALWFLLLRVRGR